MVLGGSGGSSSSDSKTQEFAVNLTSISLEESWSAWPKTCMLFACGLCNLQLGRSKRQCLLGQVAGDGDDLVFQANFVEGSAHAEPIHTLLLLRSPQRHKT